MDHFLVLNRYTSVDGRQSLIRGLARHLVTARPALSFHFAHMSSAYHDIFGNFNEVFTKQVGSEGLADKVEIALEDTGLDRRDRSFQENRISEMFAHSVPLVLSLDNNLRRLEDKLGFTADDWLLRSVNGYNLGKTLRILGNWIRHQDEIVDLTDKNSKRLTDNLRFFREMGIHPMRTEAAAFILSLFRFARYIDLEAHLLIGAEWTLQRRHGPYQGIFINSPKIKTFLRGRETIA